MSKRSLTAVLLVVTIATVGLKFPQTVRAATVDLEYQVKAAFLYNFAKFVEWPDEAFAGADAPFVFCVVGTDPFGESLERTINDRRASGRKIIVRHHRDIANLDHCHLVFIGETEDANVARDLQEVSGLPVLTVGESEAFASAGGMIRLVVEEKRVRFDINEKAADKVGLKMRSQLLKLARHVTH